MATSLERALDILELIARQPDGLTLKGMLEQLHIPKSTLCMLLNVLRERGYVEKTPEAATYRLGTKLLLVAASSHSSGLITIVQPFLKTLALEAQESAALAVLDRSSWEAVYVDKVSGPHSLRVEMDIGERRPLHCSSVGKAILAALSDKELERYFHEIPLTQLTHKTITDPTRLRKEIDQIRAMGYAIASSERVPDVGGVAATISPSGYEPVAAIGVGAPPNRLEPRLDVLISLVTGVASEIAKRLGLGWQ